MGRSAQRAYAYLLHPQGFDLPEDARKRLDTLADTDNLGAGFNIAMRDLEIRGAGEILGARQHGQVAAIGLDLYTRLLAEAINRVRADAPESAELEAVSEELAQIDPGALPTVDLPVDAFLPISYVSQTNERTRLYRRMAGATNLEDVIEVEKELRDRFGQPPQEVRFLIDVLWLRVVAHLARARSVAKEGSKAVVRWMPDHTIKRQALKRVLPNDAIIGKHQVSLNIVGRPENWIPVLRHRLEIIAGVEGRGGGRG